MLLVALLVVGPEKLPALAAQVGRWVGKARRLVQSVRADIESEIRAVEMHEMLQKQQNEIKELQSMLSQDALKTQTSKQTDMQDNALLDAVEEELSKPGHSDIPTDKSEEH